ncbi:isochorismate pyruvate lyase [Thermoflexales bacterium]|nr:isochorismate pyruvate lyase [Thermoflexales bacterium]
MEIVNRLAPEACTNLEDVRSEIDYLDRAVIAILGKRFKYVLAAARFKTSETSVRAPERQIAMLARRREWAEAEGISPDAIEKMYTDLVQHFIEEEMKRWKSQQAQA